MARLSEIEIPSVPSMLGTFPRACLECDCRTDSNTERSGVTIARVIGTTGCVVRFDLTLCPGTPGCCPTIFGLSLTMPDPEYVTIHNASNKLTHPP